MPLLANAVLVIHFLFVLFIVGGLLAIWVGALLGWRWIRNFQFRVLHLAAILFVAGESVLGIACPLTVWEDWLRGTAPQKAGFIQRWVSFILYHDFPEWVFLTVYLAFALIVIWTFRAVPPIRRHKA